MLTLAQQLVIDNFSKKIVEVIKQQIKTKPVKRVSVKTSNGKVSKSSFSSPVNASGKLVNSVSYEITDVGITISANDYIYYLLYGRKPTKSGGGGTLKDTIKQWMRDKGIKPDGDMTEDTLAFLITRKIHKYGSSIYLANQPTTLLDNILSDDTFP
jgi:hypothetical protein